VESEQRNRRLFRAIVEGDSALLDHLLKNETRRETGGGKKGEVFLV